MFNLLKKKSKEIKEIITQENTNEIVEKIHNEFFTAGEKLLIEAKKIIEKSAQKDLSKANRLEALGFNNIPEVKELNKIKQNVIVSKEVSKLIMEYSIKYPLYKFITEEQIKTICSKYNLVFGETERYKGFLPEKNLKEIENFKSQYPNFNNNLYASNGLVFENAEIRTEGEFGHIFKKNESDKYNYAFQCGEDNFTDFYSDDGKNIFGYRHLGKLRFTIRDSSLMICAPIKEMDTTGMELEGGYKLKKHIPDPVIFQQVKGGYLIITAWGPEASDELIINEKMN